MKGMESMLTELEEMESPFFRRINADLQRSRELRTSLQDLLQDVRRANARQPGGDDALPR